MKVKTVEFKRIETETELDYPIYLYFQDDMCHDEVQKIEADKTTTIKYTMFGFEIKVERSDGCVNPLHIEKCQTTEEHYEEFFTELKERL